MGAVRPLHPATDPIPINEIEIRWGTTHTWHDIVPVLRLGGARALAARIRGLYLLLEDREELDIDETRFVRDWLHDLSEALYVGDDEEPLCSATVVRKATGGA